MAEAAESFTKDGEIMDFEGWFGALSGVLAQWRDYSTRGAGGDVLGVKAAKRR